MIRKIAALLLAGLCLLLCACASQPESRDALSLWYPEEAPLARLLPELAEAYNQNRSPSALPLALRCFPDEQALLDALSAAPPDLLLCSQELALPLYESGALRPLTLTTAPEYGAMLLGRSEAVGSSFFPLGSELELLCGSAETIGSLDNLEALFAAAAEYGAANARPFLGADALAPLLYQLMLGRGSEFHARRDLDGGSRVYRDAYNLIAEAAFQGGLDLEADPLSRLTDGALPCAVLSSGALVGLEEENLAFRPLPGRAAEEALLARCWGLAVTAGAGRNLRSAGAFLGWLLEGERAASLPLKAGLVPALPGEVPADTALSRLLLELRDAVLHLPDGESDYVRNHRDFEARFRAALALF